MKRNCFAGALLLCCGAAPAYAQGAAPARPVRHSGTSDRRNFVVGDVITVSVDENTLATANQSNTASDRRRRNLDLSASGTGMMAALPPTGGGIGTGNDADSRQYGDAVRRNSFRGEMSVRIVAIEPGGLLQLEGKKAVNVDQNRQELTLSGYVRPQDVSPRNTVESWRVGDAEVVYSAQGSLGKPKGGMISRIIGAFWP